MTIDLQKMNDDLSIATTIKPSRSGSPADYLPPRLWEPLRIELQRIYRRATGEEFAVLKVENEI